ncbi:hypothetical protein ACFYYP_32520 [Microbispora rosea]|uniref:hypothetical protein n=1 Tax=Microbispora rosea TaxID=58117 RepID=UPI00367560DF
MKAARRRWLRTSSGTLLVSLGTAVFSGAVSIVVDGIVKSASLRWPSLIGFTLLGLILSGGGAWLITTLRTGVGMALAATDRAGDQDRYLDEAEAFATFGQKVFVLQTLLQVPVETTRDLPMLRNRLTAGIRTLIQGERGARSVGLLFQGRQHVGFHVGSWLNVASRRVDLYSDIRDGEGESHFLAIKLGPRLKAGPRPLDLLLLRSTDNFTTPQPVTPTELPTLLTAGTCTALAVNLNGPVNQTGFLEPVLNSARNEGASTVVIAALPDGTGFWLNPNTSEYGSTVSALMAIATSLPTAPGLLYLKTPAVIAVALGRLLHATSWIPMRYDGSGSYDRFLLPRR